MWKCWPVENLEMGAREDKAELIEATGSTSEKNFITLSARM